MEDNNVNFSGTLPITNSSNCITLGYPYSYQTTQVNFATIDKAENGWIITKDSKKYVAKKLEDVIKILEETKK